MVFFPGKGGCCGSLIIGNLTKSCRETQFGRLGRLPPAAFNRPPPSHFVYVLEQYPNQVAAFSKVDVLSSFLEICVFSEKMYEIY